MNIKLTPKAVDQETGQLKPQQVTKLAIGKPGGVDAETDKYETSVVVFCRECQAELPLSNPRVASLVDSVLLANSAYNQSTICEWENELINCVHMKNLDQSQASRIVEQNLAKCNNCDLKANLWLCMTCGNLACGRQNHDGTGGNGHALAHFESTHHPASLKLGTITPEGSASIYCYACNEDVLDDKLASHLLTLGIDIQKQTKTEKSITEMNLEANLSLTLSKILEQGKVLVPIFGPGYTGMENLGNTCYMNSVVQCLFSFPEFQNYFYPAALKHLKNCAKDSPDCYQC